MAGKVKSCFEVEKQNDALKQKSKKMLYGGNSHFNLSLFSMCWATCGPHMGRHLILPHHHLCHLITEKANLSKYPRVYTHRKQNWTKSKNMLSNNRYEWSIISSWARSVPKYCKFLILFLKLIAHPEITKKNTGTSSKLNSCKPPSSN
jgi:hypothetical protein